jgi:hypothetical protein
MIADFMHRKCALLRLVSGFSGFSSFFTSVRNSLIYNKRIFCLMFWWEGAKITRETWPSGGSSILGQRTEGSMDTLIAGHRSLHSVATIGHQPAHDSDELRKIRAEIFIFKYATNIPGLRVLIDYCLSGLSRAVASLTLDVFHMFVFQPHGCTIRQYWFRNVIDIGQFRPAPSITRA